MKIEDTATNIAGQDETVQYERAKFSDRFFAAFVDNIIIMVPYRLIGYFGMAISPLLFGFVIPFLLTLGYYAVFAQRNNGQTFGKKWNDIKVVDKNGNDLTMGHFLLREFIARGLIFVLALFVGMYGYLWYFTFLLALSANRLALHDIIAGTQVIKTKK